MMAMSSWEKFPLRRSWWERDIPAEPPPITTILWLRVGVWTGDTVARLRMECWKAGRVILVAVCDARLRVSADMVAGIRDCPQGLGR